MKKTIFSLIIAVVLSLFSFSVLAETEDVYFSDDYSKMYFGNETFSLRDTSYMTENYQEYEINVPLSDEQSSIINEILVWMDDNNLTASASVYYKSGAYLSLSYMNDEIVDKYERFFDEANKYTVDFEWPDDNVVIAEKSLLYGEKRVMDFNASDYYTYDVFITDEDMGISIYKGIVADIDGAFYFIDYEENEVSDIYDFDYEFTPDAVLHRITDNDLVQNLLRAQQDYHGRDIVSISEEGFFESFSKAFIIVLFCVIPAIILITCLLAAIRCNGIYRKLYFATCLFCAAELSVFITIMILISRYS